jgi:hypothetical protein
MPNHITNRLQICGSVEQVEAIKEFIKSPEVGIGSIDFNTITPMPKWVYQENLTLED